MWPLLCELDKTGNKKKHLNTFIEALLKQNSDQEIIFHIIHVGETFIMNHNLIKYLNL